MAEHLSPANPPAMAITPKVKAVRVPSAATLARREQQLESKRAAISEAAIGLFSQFGLHGVRVEQIAARAEVSKTNLLYYFASKEDLYLYVLKQLLGIWLAPLRALRVEMEPLHAISEYLRLKLELSRDHPAASRLFCLEIIQGAPLLRGELEHELRDLVQDKRAVIQHWVDAGQLAPIDPYHLIFSLWATTQHYADFRVQVESITGRTLDDPVFFEEVLTNLQALLLNGLRLR
ncbi:transcriptional regulator, TetR family [Pseudomonas cuatrocienegasensis]|uniref:Transcriptional regulator, TetR family n=1 Tax=Pseudomonas cuatrocienegasensis TaxID=543360 RepID=A0ABY1B6C7_9PSED|nr:MULTISPECIES: HTH-type transcriptional regulator RutR [Pseudomonas]OEC36797.1 pyrimidine utilization regulatory protein R [Pseudomonas sp. 21C1]SEQ06920.1 transcriptional regulator, TetR family [Pseudomonas cuatrocienegasensis]